MCRAWTLDVGWMDLHLLELVLYGVRPTPPSPQITIVTIGGLPRRRFSNQATDSFTSSLDVGRVLLLPVITEAKETANN